MQCSLNVNTVCIYVAPVYPSIIRQVLFFTNVHAMTGDFHIGLWGVNDSKAG